MNRKTKRILLVLLLFVMAGMILCGGWFLHARKGSSLTVASTEDHTPANVVFFQQKDARWKDDPLGDSRYAMGDSGCLTTCLAAAFAMQDVTPEGFTEELTPGTLNAYFSVNHIYDNEGNLQWNALEQTAGITPVLKSAEETDNRELEQWLSEGIFPIVRVRMGGVGNYHFVLLVSSENGEFFCMDPLEEKEQLVPMSDFGGKIYAVRVVSE